MESYRGTIQLTELQADSKSDGVYAYLIDEEKRTFRLYRANRYPVSDPFFSEYKDEEVIVYGEIQQEEWLMVEKIERISTGNESGTNE